MGLWGLEHVEERRQQLLYVNKKAEYQVGNKEYDLQNQYAFLALSIALPLLLPSSLLLVYLVFIGVKEINHMLRITLEDTCIRSCTANRYYP